MGCSKCKFASILFYFLLQLGPSPVALFRLCLSETPNRDPLSVRAVINYKKRHQGRLWDVIVAQKQFALLLFNTKSNITTEGLSFWWEKKNSII